VPLILGISCAAFVCESPACVANREYGCPQTFSIHPAYGASDCRWGQDVEKADAVARQLQAGTVWINQHANLPFNGFKDSGLDMEFGREGLEAFCKIQIIARK
jgi:hypothetical protein